MSYEQVRIGKDAALALVESRWWEEAPCRTIAIAQLCIAELSMPFGDFQDAVEKAIGYPVATIAFTNPAALWDELVAVER